MILPAVPEPFYWTHETWGDALRCRPLDAIAPHFFTTRSLELRSGGGDSVGWRAIAGALGVDTAHLVRLRQVHGRDVVVVREGDPLRHFRLKPEATREPDTTRSEDKPEADVVVSNDSHFAIVVQAADCVPALIADPRTGAVAAVHAGWRGTAAGAATAAVEALTREFGVRPSDLIAALGPSIGACCYGVGTELVDAFAAAGHARHLIDRWFLTRPSLDASQPRLRLDLWAANRDQLVLAGLDEQNVHASGLCTASNVDVLYSYRVEGAGTGRLAAAIRPKVQGERLKATTFPST